MVMGGFKPTEELETTIEEKNRSNKIRSVSAVEKNPKEMT